ncbi:MULTISPECIES: basic amino acid ABC transporter substrate-binding protein [Campylobacter]|uniref:basic amino acid ABC transporter substrate-binding protein n=1 Tax=Campylobacter TaxID=194 RepID=UPI0019D20154|nr:MULTISPECIES: basic amino acid ABC transporter substrate-binding protein [Campylobacter]MBN7287533.1 basic amino acid ABC transporter substrate-binding protein [Campylobacter curvus]MDU6826599.1 basic amino acid ABC transporter substrate-binding protein [Campylobacter sp.]
MKKLFAFLVAALFFVGCGDSADKSSSAKASAPSSSEQVFKVGASADYPPFEFIDDKNKITGFDIDLLEAIGNKIGVKFEVQNISFDGLIPALKTGKIDAIMSAMSATEDRRKSVDFTKPYYSTENLFIRKKGSDVNDSNIGSKQIGVQLGTVQEIAARAITGAKVVPAEAIGSSILALKAGKIDIVLVDSSIGYGYLKQNPDLEEFLKLPDGSEGFSIAFDKGKHVDLIGKINMAIDELKKDGTFDKILQKYDLK